MCGSGVGNAEAGTDLVLAAQARRIDQLEEALARRDLLGQAKGILMERYKITSDQAFAFLARASSEANMKLRDVAGELVATGEMKL